MNPILATSTQANLLYVLGGGFVLLGSYFFGRLVTFFFPKNPLVRKDKKDKSKSEQDLQTKAQAALQIKTSAKRQQAILSNREIPIGATGFEPATQCSQSPRATKLRHAPEVFILRLQRCLITRIKKIFPNQPLLKTIIYILGIVQTCSQNNQKKINIK